MSRTNKQGEGLGKEGGQPGQRENKEKSASSHVLIYGDELAGVEYSPSHPFRPIRAKLFLELLHRYYDLREDHFRIKRPEPLDEDLLYLVHGRPYIELLKKAGKGEFQLEMLEARAPWSLPRGGQTPSLIL
ncbi:MAG: hypothetical protein ABSC19_07910 [Syntrophorhabdales bacterium]